jgi:hypothetical protein
VAEMTRTSTCTGHRAGVDASLCTHEIGGRSPGCSRRASLIARTIARDRHTVLVIARRSLARIGMKGADRPAQGRDREPISWLHHAISGAHWTASTPTTPGSNEPNHR